MTLNCDFDMQTARTRFAERKEDSRAKDLIESAMEYWAYGMISDLQLAVELRKVADYLDPDRKAADVDIIDFKPARFKGWE